MEYAPWSLGSGDVSTAPNELMPLPVSVPFFQDVYGHGVPDDPGHAKALEIITYVGCSLSIVALALAIFTLTCCK